MIITRTSPLTGKDNTMDLPINSAQVTAWENGALIQNVMPRLTPDQREFLISGLYPGEFEQLFPPEEE